MTVPPPKPKVSEARVAVAIEEPDSISVPVEVATIYEGPDMDWLGEDEQDELVKRTVLRLNPVLHFGREAFFAQRDHHFLRADRIAGRASRQ